MCFDSTLWMCLMIIMYLTEVFDSTLWMCLMIIMYLTEVLASE